MSKNSIKQTSIKNIFKNNKNTNLHPVYFKFIQECQILLKKKF